MAKTGEHDVKPADGRHLMPYAEVHKRIVVVRGQSVILDVDVATLYGVETKRVNEAVRNNRDKFPEDYMFELDADESRVLRSKISTLEQNGLTLERGGKGRYSKYNYKAFTEKGLYMLATVLKSRRAVDATFAIIETFAKVRGLKRELIELHNETDRKKQSEKMHHFGETLADIVMPDLDTASVTRLRVERARPRGSVALPPRRVRYASAGGTRTATQERGPSASPRPLRVCGLDEHGHAGAWPSRLVASATRLREGRVRPCGRDALLRVRGHAGRHAPQRSGRLYGSRSSAGVHLIGSHVYT